MGHGRRAALARMEAVCARALAAAEVDGATRGLRGGEGPLQVGGRRQRAGHAAVRRLRPCGRRGERGERPPPHTHTPAPHPSTPRTRRPRAPGGPHAPASSMPPPLPPARANPTASVRRPARRQRCVCDCLIGKRLVSDQSLTNYLLSIIRLHTSVCNALHTSIFIII